MATIQLPDVPSFQTMLTAAQAGDSKSRLAGAINTAINEFSPEKLKERYELSKYIKDLKSAYITPDEARARLKLQLKLLTDASGNPLFKSEEEINKQVNELISKLGSESNIMNDRNEFIRNKKNTIDQNRKELYNKLAYEAKLKKLKSQQSNSERIGGMLYRSLGYKADVSGIELPGQVINSIDESVDAEYPTISDQDLQQMAEKEYPAERSIAVKDLDKYIEDIKTRSSSQLGSSVYTAQYSKIEDMPSSIRSFWVKPGEYRVSMSFGTPTSAVWTAPVKGGNKTKLTPNQADITMLTDILTRIRNSVNIIRDYQPEYVGTLYDLGGKYTPTSTLKEAAKDLKIMGKDKELPNLGVWTNNYQELVNTTIKAITGAQMSESEAGRIMSQLPSLVMKPPVFEKQLINSSTNTVKAVDTLIDLFDWPKHTLKAIEERKNELVEITKRLPITEADKQTKSESPKKTIGSKDNPYPKGTPLGNIKLGEYFIFDDGKLYRHNGKRSMRADIKYKNVKPVN